MLTLYQTRQSHDVVNISPFCAKLETFLRMAKIDYQVDSTVKKAFLKAPNGKLPWVEIDGKAMPDSSLIIRHLQKQLDVDFSSHYSPEQQAQALGTQRLLEDHLYWGMGYFRWEDDPAWPPRAVAVAYEPAPFKALLGKLLKRMVLKQINQQGLGRHDADTILAMCHDDIKAVSAQLADKPYYMGDSISLIDCTVFGFIGGLVNDPSKSRLRAVARQYTNLVDYCERIGQQYFPEVYTKDR